MTVLEIDTVHGPETMRDMESRSGMETVHRETLAGESRCAAQTMHAVTCE